MDPDARRYTVTTAVPRIVVEFAGMERLSASARFESEVASLLSQALVRELVLKPSLNEFMERALPLVGEAFGSGKVILVDYREHFDRFDVLFFEGYGTESLYALGRRLGEMEVRKALATREPYHSSQSPGFLVIPLYFSDILEAVVVLEGLHPIELTDSRREAARVASRFLGVVMSSTRLAVNREQLVDTDDLQRARQIQLSFLPKQYPSSDRCQVYGCNTSSASVGGDYFDFFRIRDGSLQCILADACGHGMAAALIMSNFRGLLQSEMARRGEYVDLFAALNESVHFDEDFIQYLTGVFLDFDETSRRLSYLNAGHYDPIVIGEDGRHRTLPGGGPPLGMFRGSRYPHGEARLNTGDVITLFTDGLIDIHDGKGRYFGEEGVIETVRLHRKKDLAAIAEEVIANAQRFADGAPVEDDVTLFLMRVC